MSDIEEQGDIIDELPKDPSDKEAETPEEQARRMGWKPEDEFEGKNEWVDADTFLDNTDNDPVQQRKSLRTIKRNYIKLEKGVDAILAHQERQVDIARQEGYEKAQAESDARFNQAVEDGDDEAVRELYKQKTSEQPEHDPVVEAWAKDNPWYKTDPIMTDAAAVYQKVLINKGVSIADSLADTTEYIKLHFPQMFPKQRRAPNVVNGANRNNVVVKTKVEPGSYEALTPEFRTQCDNFVKRMKAKGFTNDAARSEFMDCAQPEMFQ